jgi:hypothetical protein
MFALLVAASLAVPADAQAAVAAAIADATRRFSATATVTEVERVTWRDGSLGCPQPDMMATQALVPGWRIVLQTASGAAEYHASAAGRVVYCPPGRSRPPLPDTKS